MDIIRKMKLPVYLVYTEMTRVNIQIRPNDDLHASIGSQLGVSPSDLVMEVVNGATGEKVLISTWQGIQEAANTVSDPALYVSVPIREKGDILEELELSVENLQQLAKSQALCLHNALLQIQALKQEAERYHTRVQERTGCMSMDQFVFVDETAEHEFTNQIVLFTPHRED